MLSGPYGFQPDRLRYRSGCCASLRGVHCRSADRFALASAERGPAHLRLGTDAYGVAPPQFWAQDDSAAIRSEWPTGRRRGRDGCLRSEEHTSELQSLMRISYAVFCLKKKKTKITTHKHTTT